MKNFLKKIKLFIKTNPNLKWIEKFHFYALRIVNKTKLIYFMYSKKKRENDLSKALEKYGNFKANSKDRNLNDYFNDLYVKYDNHIHESIRNILLPKKKISINLILLKVKELVSNKMIIWESHEIINEHTFSQMKSNYLKEGYIICPFKLASSEVHKFTEVSKKINYIVQGRKNESVPINSSLPKDFSDAKGIQYLHKITSSSLIQYPIKVRQLLFEISCYLMDQDCLQICSDQLWYSFPVQKLESEHDAAQKWHFDSDAIEWIKIFTFMTNVNKKSGAHQAILRTHRTGAKSLNIRSYGTNRIPDDVINEEFDEKQSFDLSAGSIVFGNTKCLHRGQPLENGKHRLMHQFYLTVSPGSFVFPQLYQYKSHSLSSTQIDDKVI